MCLFTLIYAHKSTVCFFFFFFSRLDETPQPMEVNGSQPSAPEGSETTGTQDIKVSQLILIDDKVFAPCNGIWMPESSEELL